MPDLTPAEQFLLSAFMSSKQNQQGPTDPQALDAIQTTGDAYFGIYRLDWSGAAAELQAQGFAGLQSDRLSLTPAGAVRAAELRQAHPRYLYAYNEFFHRARRSPAHARFCEQVYGRDLCQHGMADMRQVDDLAARLKEDGVRSFLELGCGSGAVTAYIATQTGASATGVDIAEEGIAWADSLAAANHQLERLHFLAADMTTVDFPPASFDAILIIDGVYFAGDAPVFLTRILDWLKPSGKLYVLYSVWLSANEPAELLQPRSTRFAQALNELSLPYETGDYSTEEARHWIRKRQVAGQMRSAFEAEGNLWLWQRRGGEAEAHQEYVGSSRVARYLYVIHPKTVIP